MGKLTWIKQFYVTILLGVIVLGLLGCASATSQYSPDQVINNAIEETTALGSYYSEVEMTTSEEGTEIEQVIMKEWRSDDGKARVEIGNKDGGDQSISVNDGNQLILYEQERNQAFTIDDPELLAFNQPSPKEQTNLWLEMIRDTHDISTEGEEEIIGRATYHLVAKPKEENTLFGEQEFWIDKENWLVLKMIQHTGDTKDEILYTKIDFDVKILPELFTLDLPADVDIQNLVDLSQTTEIALEEVADKMEQPIHYFPEKAGLEITAIEMIDIQGEQMYREMSFDYTKNDLPLLTLSIFESPEAEAFDFSDGESVVIRNQEGFYIEFDDIRTLLWQEKGLSYSIMIIDPNLTVEDLKELADEMIVVE